MTKIEYIDFIRNSLPMVDKTNKYHPEQVAAAINVAVNTVFYEMYEQQPKVFMKAMERYTTLATLSVGKAVTALRFKSTLTVDIVDLPKKAGGILEIAQQTAAGAEVATTTTQFVPVSTMEGEQFYGSEASLPGNVIGFSWAGEREIEYWEMAAAVASIGVKARYIIQFKSYASTDNVLLPYGQDQRIIELVRQFLGAIPPKDLVNDNADIKLNG